MADSWYVLGSILVSILLYLVIAKAFRTLYVPPVVDVSEFTSYCRGSIRPEQTERYLYLIGLACIPTLPTAAYGLLRWIGRRSSGLTALLERPGLLMARDLMLVLGVVAWLYRLARRSEIPRMSIMLIYALAFVGLIALVARLRLKVPRVAVGVAVAGLLIASTWMMTLNADWLISSWYVAHHFDLPLGAVNQVWHGKTVLVDTTSQYGILYPYIAAWTLAPFGLSVRSLGAFFSAASLLCWVFAYAAVGRKAGYGSVAALAFTAAFLGVTQTDCLAKFLSNGDYLLYYQILPLRMISGMFFLWFVPIYLRSRRPPLLLAGYLAAGFWLIWNSDTGLIVLVAWFGVQVFLALGAWREGLARMVAKIAGHGVLTGLTGTLSVWAYLAFARLRSGRSPDLAEYSDFQRIFYASGFYALPMRLWEFWQPIVLIYALVVAWSLRRAIWGRVTPDTAWYFFIAIYGLGQFPYYQNRSHYENLTKTFYPAVFLSFLVAYDGWQAVCEAPWAEALRDPRKRWTLLVAGLCSVGFAFGLMNFCRAIKPAVSFASKRVPHQTGDALPVLHMEEDPPTFHLVELPPAIRAELTGKKGVVLMDAGNIVLVALGSESSLPFASPSEVILIRQLRRMQEALDGDETEFILMNPKFALNEYLDLGKYKPFWQSETLVLLKKGGP